MLMKYHPRIGYTYTPSLKSRVPREGGGYLVKTNAAGFRSDREFVAQRRPGTVRALMFGDSQTAGDGVANAERYSDLLEKAVPGLEVYNYGLSGTGTDQQYLAYQQCADVEHDLVVVGIYVENILRLGHRVLKFSEADSSDGYYAKPYFLIENEELVLHNVPVARRPWTQDTLPADQLPYVYRFGQTVPAIARVMKRLRGAVPNARLRRLGRQLVLRLTRFQPLPDYQTPDQPGWQLMSRILERWISASRAPVLLITLPTFPYIERTSDPASYQARFRELALRTGCHVYDPLPELWKLSFEERVALAAGHLSPRGHEAMARFLAPIVARLSGASAAALASSR